MSDNDELLFNIINAFRDIWSESFFPWDRIWPQTAIILANAFNISSFKELTTNINSFDIGLEPIRIWLPDKYHQKLVINSFDLKYAARVLNVQVSSSSFLSRGSASFEFLDSFLKEQPKPIIKNTSPSIDLPYY